MLMIEMTGLRFGRLTVIKRAPKRPDLGMVFWECLCDCGKSTTVRGSYLRDGRSRSCGCLRYEKLERRYIHGLSHLPEYQAWKNITIRYSEKFCDEWRESFEKFLEDMGPKPTPKHRLKKRERDKPYSKENCYWQSPEERESRWLEYQGEKISVYKLSLITGVSKDVILGNMERHNCNAEEAISIVIKNRKERVRKKQISAGG